MKLGGYLARKLKIGNRCITPEKSWKRDSKPESFSKAGIWRENALSIFYLATGKLSNFQRRSCAASRLMAPAAHIRQRSRPVLRRVYRSERRSVRPRNS